MANYCSFEIRIKGKRGNVLLFSHSIPTIDGGSYAYARGTDEAYEVCFCGSCKWSVNFNVTDDWEGLEIDTDLNVLPESVLASIGSDYSNYSLRAKSRVLECEVLAHYWSTETEFDHFDHYIDGRRIRKRRIAYDSSNIFDWNTLEYIGHEGEIDEELTDEATSLLYANRFVRQFDPASVLSVLEDQDGDVIENKNDDEEETDEDETLQSLQELLDKLKVICGDSDDDDEDDEEEEATDDDSCVERLKVNDYWLTPSVQFLVPEGFAVEKKTSNDGEMVISIMGGKQETNGTESFLLKGSVQIKELSYEESSLPGQQWLERKMQEEDSAEMKYVQIPGNVAALLSSQKLPEIEILNIKIRPFSIQLEFRCDQSKQLSVVVPCIKEKANDRHYFYLLLLTMLNGFRISGQALNCGDLSDHLLYSELEPRYDDELYSEICFSESNRLIQSDWHVARPDGFCEWKKGLYKYEIPGKMILVPESHVFTEEFQDIPIVISIDAAAADFDIDECDYIDIASKQGYVRQVGVQFARDERESKSLPYNIQTVSHDDAGVIILSVSSDNMALCTCILFTHQKVCEMAITVRADSLNAAQFFSSVGHWLSTFHFADSKWLRSPILLEQPACLEDALRGDLVRFDEAIDQLTKCYMVAVIGCHEFLDYTQSNPGVIKAALEKNARILLQASHETKALGVQKADAFLEKLKKRGASEEVLKHVYTKLEDFDQAHETYQMNIEDDESNNEIELENGTKITQFMHRALHDTQIVRVNEPLSIKAVIAKWKQEAGVAEPSGHGFGFMSPLEFARAKQQIAESQTKRDMQRTQLMDRVASYVEVAPEIVFPGKKFVFTGLGTTSNEQKDHPIVQAVLAKGGIYRSRISGVTDYLAVGDDSPGVEKINDAIEQKNAGKPIQIIWLRDLEAVLEGKSRPVVGANPIKVEESEQSEVVDPETLASIQENLSKLSQEISTMRDAFGQYADFQRQQEEDERRREHDRQFAKDNAEIDEENDEACMHVVLSIIEELHLTDKYGSDQSFYECYGEDFPAYEQASLWELRCRVFERRQRDEFKTTYEQRFRSFDASTKFMWTVTAIVNISPEFDIAARFKQAMQMARKWFDTCETDAMQAELQELKNMHRDGLRPQFAAICEEWLQWSTAKPLMYVEYRNAPSPYDENTMSCQVGNTVVTLRIRSSKSNMIVSQILNWYAWYWNVSCADIWAAAYQNRFDSRGNPLQDSYVSDFSAEGDSSSTRLCKALDAMGITYQSHPSVSAERPKAPGVSAPTYRMAALDNSVSVPAKPKKEGCYIATAVYGSYDAPEVLVLRRFRDEVLRKTALGRWFIRVYYRLSPAIADKLRSANHLNGIVRKCLDRWVHHLQKK